MAKETSLRARIVKALDELGADVVHLGVFDYATMFRERRLRREELLAGAETAVFANVLPKWDTAEEIRFPGPYGSESLPSTIHRLSPAPR